MIQLPQHKGESDTTQRPSMADLEYSLVNTIIQNGQDSSQLDAILEDLRTREELLIYRVTDADSEQAYTKGCLMRFLGLACKEFGIEPVQFRLLPALNSSLAGDDSETAAGPSIIEVFRCSGAHAKLSQIEDVLHIDSFLKKPHTDQKPRRQQLFGYNVTVNNSHTIDRTWIPAFVVSVAKLVISMQDTTPTWPDVVATVQDLVTESFSMLQGGWMEAGLCLAAIVLMEGEGTQLTGLTANTVASMLGDKFTFECLHKAAGVDMYCGLMLCLQKLTVFATDDDLADNFGGKCSRLMLQYNITTASATNYLDELEAKMSTQYDVVSTNQTEVNSQPRLSSITFRVVQHAIVCLALDKKDDFIIIARAVEKSRIVSDEDRFLVWGHWFEYLSSFGGLFLESGDKLSPDDDERKSYDQRRDDLITVTRFMARPSLDFFAGCYVELAKQAEMNSLASNEEKKYISHASRQTVLRLFVHWGNTNGGASAGIRRFEEFFPSTFPIMAFGGSDQDLEQAAFIYLKTVHMSAPPSLLNLEDKVDVTLLENRASILAQEQQLLLLEETQRRELSAFHVQEEQRMFEQARDFAAQQRQTWLREAVVEDIVEVDEDIIMKTHKPIQEETAAPSDAENSDIAAHGNEPEECIEVDSGEEDVGAHESDEYDDEESDDVVEIVDSSDEEEGVVEVRQSDDDDQSVYSDEYNDDEEMEDVDAEDQSQDGRDMVKVVGDHEAAGDESEDDIDVVEVGEEEDSDDDDDDETVVVDVGEDDDEHHDEGHVENDGDKEHPREETVERDCDGDDVLMEINEDDDERPEGQGVENDDYEFQGEEAVEEEDIDEEHVSNDNADFEADEEELFVDDRIEEEVARDAEQLIHRDSGHETADEDQVQALFQSHANHQQEPVNALERIDEVSDTAKDEEDQTRDEEISMIDDQHEDLGETGSQVDKGYEPDTAAHTEGEVSEEYLSDEEDNYIEEEEKRFAADNGRVMSDGFEDRCSSTTSLANNYSDSHMDAADEQTASDIGAESSEMEEGASLRPGVTQPPSSSTKTGSVLLNYAYSAQSSNVGDHRELATDVSRKHAHLQDEDPVLTSALDSVKVSQDTHVSTIAPLGNISGDLSGSGNMETIGVAIKNEVQQIDDVDNDDDVGSEDDVAVNADLDTEPDHGESQPESESVADRDPSIRDVNDVHDSDATTEFPPEFHRQAADANRTDYDADVSEAPRVDDDEPAGDEVSIERVMDPPPSRPAKLYREKSVSFKEEGAGVIEVIPPQPNRAALLREDPTTVCFSDPRSAGEYTDEDEAEEKVSGHHEEEISEDLIVDHVPENVVNRSSLSRDVSMLTHAGDQRDTLISDAGQEDDFPFAEPAVSKLESVANSVVDRLPPDELSRPLLTREHSTMVQTGNTSDDGSISVEIQVEVDQLPPETLPRPALSRDQSTMVQAGNASDDSLVVNDLTEAESEEQANGSMFEHAAQEGERSQMLDVFPILDSVEVPEGGSNIKHESVQSDDVEAKSTRIWSEEDLVVDAMEEENDVVLAGSTLNDGTINDENVESASETPSVSLPTEETVTGNIVGVFVRAGDVVEEPVSSGAREGDDEHVLADLRRPLVLVPCEEAYASDPIAVAHQKESATDLSGDYVLGVASSAIGCTADIPVPDGSLVAFDSTLEQVVESVGDGCTDIHNPAVEAAELDQEDPDARQDLASEPIAVVDRQYQNDDPEGTSSDCVDPGVAGVKTEEDKTAAGGASLGEAELMDVVSRAHEPNSEENQTVEHVTEQAVPRSNDEVNITNARYPEDDEVAAEAAKDAPDNKTPGKSIGVESTDAEFKSPLRQIWKSAGKAVLGVVNLLSPFPRKRAASEEIPADEDTDGCKQEMEAVAEMHVEDEYLRRSHRHHHTPPRSDSFVWSDPVHHHDDVRTEEEEEEEEDKANVEADSKHIASAVGGQSRTQNTHSRRIDKGEKTNEDNDEPGPASVEIKRLAKVSRSKKNKEEESDASISRRRSTRSSTSTTRTSTRAATMKTSSKIIPVCRSSRRSRASATSKDHDDDDENSDESGTEALSDIEGRSLAFQPETQPSPSLSSIAPSSIASTRTRRRTHLAPVDEASPSILDASTIDSAVLMDLDTDDIEPIVSTPKRKRGRPAKSLTPSKVDPVKVEKPIEEAVVESTAKRTRGHLARALSKRKDEDNSELETEVREKIEEARVATSHKRKRGPPTKTLVATTEGTTEVINIFQVTIEEEAPVEPSPKRTRGRQARAMPEKKDKDTFEVQWKAEEKPSTSPKRGRWPKALTVAKEGDPVEADNDEKKVKEAPVSSSPKQKRRRSVKTVVDAKEEAPLHRRGVTRSRRDLGEVNVPHNQGGEIVGAVNEDEPANAKGESHVYEEDTPKPSRKSGRGRREKGGALDEDAKSTTPAPKKKPAKKKVTEESSVISSRTTRSSRRR